MFEHEWCSPAPSGGRIFNCLSEDVFGWGSGSDWTNTREGQEGTEIAATTQINNQKKGDKQKKQRGESTEIRDETAAKIGMEKTKKISAETAGTRRRTNRKQGEGVENKKEKIQQ
jgi:hypothetical protein